MTRTKLIRSGALALALVVTLVGMTWCHPAATSESKWFAAIVDGLSSGDRKVGESYGECPKLTQALNDLEAKGFAPGQVVLVGTDRAVVVCRSK
jgi:hypothetical protein